MKADILNVIFGVKQGKNLSALLFLLYTNGYNMTYSS